ncbi:RdgB/HAM1 family non-canonical purine NTP pyrophosphatase [Luteimonas terricola]|uniref:dITP/XTP pyrophosphatase n=1 Tax=Luteimonas terricola TaxID=645597 RepID=A0ABQ2E9M3_9GAMM|nr:RdgB/HAM1 family non-canonical purine NTP pyrophosphatase [Luteimonas terricola]GGJ98827.1 non-canonical purine NTP pyrophosphatase [Luteimonas terricola]
MDLVLASGNAGKLAELHALLGGDGFSLRAQSEFGVDDVEETGLTFVENALLKARNAAQVTGLPALADDSGLCVDALGGAPGLYSARYAGPGGDAARNIERLLRELDGVADGARGASFHCCIVLLRDATDPRPLVVEGSWRGRILRTARGEGGFGYDPVFLDPDSGLTAAELPAAIKNAVSHRGRALAALRARLSELA